MKNYKEKNYNVFPDVKSELLNTIKIDLSKVNITQDILSKIKGNKYKFG